MKNGIYLIKNLAPWMMDELLAFSELTKFKIIFLRKQKDFYKDSINRLQNNGVIIYTKPFVFSNLLQKICFLIPFILKNLNKFFGGYNAAISLKSIGWFLRIDLNKFDKNTSIHAQFATQASVLSLMLKEYFNNEIEYSFTFHAHDIYFNNKWFSELVNESKFAFSISEYNINYVKEKYPTICINKIKLSRLGVFRPNDIKPKLINKKSIFKIGFISWFIEKKGLKYLLEAMKYLQNENIELILAGDGPLKKDIINFIENNELKNVKYIGIVKGIEKDNFFRNLDVFVLPAITIPNGMDGLPVVLMEAISYGLPIISSKISGIPEICINEYNGFLILEKNVEQIVNSIRKLMVREIYSKLSKNSLNKSIVYDIKKNSINKIMMLEWKQ